MNYPTREDIDAIKGARDMMSLAAKEITALRAEVENAKHRAGLLQEQWDLALRQAQANGKVAADLRSQLSARDAERERETAEDRGAKRTVRAAAERGQRRNSTRAAQQAAPRAIEDLAAKAVHGGDPRLAAAPSCPAAAVAWVKPA